MLQMSYKKLQVWQKSMTLAKLTYALSKSFPRDERYGLTSQIRRSAISVPSNIAEGSQRGSQKEFMHFVLIARGSLAELETQLLLADQFEYCQEKDLSGILSLLEEVSRMLYAFYSSLTTHDS